jgi:hypothetical protein
LPTDGRDWPLWGDEFERMAFNNCLFVFNVIDYQLIELVT